MTPTLPSTRWETLANGDHLFYLGTLKSHIARVTEIFVPNRRGWRATVFLPSANNHRDGDLESIKRRVEQDVIDWFDKALAGGGE